MKDSNFVLSFYFFFGFCFHFVLSVVVQACLTLAVLQAEKGLLDILMGVMCLYVFLKYCIV